MAGRGGWSWESVVTEGGGRAVWVPNPDADPDLFAAFRECLAAVRQSRRYVGTGPAGGGCGVRGASVGAGAVAVTRVTTTRPVPTDREPCDGTRCQAALTSPPGRRSSGGRGTA